MPWFPSMEPRGRQVERSCQVTIPVRGDLKANAWNCSNISVRKYSCKWNPSLHSVCVVPGSSTCAASRPVLRLAPGRVCGSGGEPLLPAEHRHHRHHQHGPSQRPGAGLQGLRYGLHPNWRHHKCEKEHVLALQTQWLHLIRLDVSVSFFCCSLDSQYGNSGGPLVNLVRGFTVLSCV